LTKEHEDQKTETPLSQSELKDLLYIAGNECTVNKEGDLFVYYEAREFIGAECVIVKKTRAGLIQVALKDNLKRTYSVPQRNITLKV